MLGSASTVSAGKKSLLTRGQVSSAARVVQKLAAPTLQIGRWAVGAGQPGAVAGVAFRGAGAWRSGEQGAGPLPLAGRLLLPSTLSGPPGAFVGHRRPLLSRG